MNTFAESHKHAHTRTSRYEALSTFTHSKFFLVASFLYLLRGSLFLWQLTKRVKHLWLAILCHRPCLSVWHCRNCSILFVIQFFCTDTITAWCDLLHILLSLPMSCDFAVDSATWKWSRSLVTDGPIARARCSCELRLHRNLALSADVLKRPVHAQKEMPQCLGMWFWKSRSIEHS